MSEFYDDMAAMVQELLEVEDGLGQENIALVVMTKVAGADSWTPPTVAPVPHPLKGVAKSVEAKYENGALARKSGDLVTFAPLAFDPELKHFISISGAVRAITSLKRIPKAGTAVAWQAFCENT